MTTVKASHHTDLDRGIILNGLTKQYPGTKIPAVKNISLRVRKGEVYGFLGPNGAGKSTTIKLLMDFIRPTAGNASILGLDTVRGSVQIKQHTGYLSGDIAMYPRMTGRQFLDYMSQLQPVKSPEYKQSLLNRLQVDLSKKISDLSRGNRQKIAIVQAFMHEPDILILDEPTSGLDPLMQEVFYEMVSEVKARQAIVFMSSHIMSEVQRTCDRVGIIRSGELVHEYVIADLLADGAQTFGVEFKNIAPIAALALVPGLKLISNDKRSVVVQMRGKLSALFAVLAQHDVVKLTVHNSDLEDIFMEYYRTEGASK